MRKATAGSLARPARYPDNALRGHHGIPLCRGTPSRDERSLRHGNVASPTTNLPTTGLSTVDLATTRHTPANTVRCNDLLSANPSPGLMTLGY